MRNYLLILLVTTFFGCKSQKVTDVDALVKIAFMSDVHLQDIYGEFSDTDYKGIKNPITGKYNTVRAMESQLHSTRLFNENYFAFIAALNDAAKRGVKLIALPGDFSDDGQLVNVRALRKILDIYAAKYQMQFFITTGNHDPVRPFAQHAGKTDYLAENGSKQAVVSSQFLLKDESYANKPIITSDIKEMGYEGLLSELSNFGFNPKKNFKYWETPFSNYTYEDYNFESAQQYSKLTNRRYEIDSEILIPDVSYLVEPVEGVWLLALDANVYVPKENLSGLGDDSKDFNGASIGFNNVLTHKKHLITWVGKVVNEAKKRNKKLVAFSHYPMVEFNDDASEELKELFGDSKMQLHRVPKEEVAKAFADAGLQLHFGGHMHINDTGVRTTEKGNTLFNIQTPSLAGYMPAYKLLTFSGIDEVVVETIPLESVSNFNELFPLYEKEYEFLKSSGVDEVWNKQLLNSETYIQFTEWHLKELIRLRFLPKDWPESLKDKLMLKSGEDLLQTSSKDNLNSIIKSEGLTLNQFKSWTGITMINNYYRIKLADGLVFDTIGDERMREYKLVCESLINSGDPQLRLWGVVFKKACSGKPSVNFKINLKENSIQAFK